MRLTFEASEPITIARKDVREDLDRDVAAEFGVPRAIHVTHAARAEERQDLVHPDVAPHERRALVGQDVGGHRADRRREKLLRLPRVSEQRVDLLPQGLVVAARARHERRTIALLAAAARRRRRLLPAAGAPPQSPRVSFQFAEQPEFCQSPVALDGIGRHMEHFGRLLHAQSSEEPELDHPGLPQVGGR